MIRWLLSWMLKLVFMASLVAVLITLPLKIINPFTWSWQIQRAISPPEGFPEKSLHNWVDIEDISKNMQLAVIAGEDQKFPIHPGIDLDATQQAVEDYFAGKGARGASTITQQTVKNLYLWSGKSLVRKSLEASMSLLVELEWSKTRILEIYLNIVEFGPGIYGVEAASQHFFGIPASRLSQRQAASLAAVLPNPYRYNVAKPSAYQNRRINWIQKQMRQLSLGYLSKLD